MAAHIMPRSIVQYGSMLLAIVVVYNLGRHLRTGDGPRCVCTTVKRGAGGLLHTTLHDTRGATEGRSACMVWISQHVILFRL
jgi:hypothetical protein